MDNKIWRMGEHNPLTGLYFWAYQDKAHTKEVWLTLEKLKIKRVKSLEYNRNKKFYYKKRYDQNREQVLKNCRASYYTRKDYRPLFYLWKNAVNRHNSKKLGSKCELTYEDIVYMFDNQQGMCHYTGLLMELTGDKSPYKISIDRIDSSLNYTRDNCVLCCQCINYAKNSYTLREFSSFLHNAYNNPHFINLINEKQN